MYYNQQIIVYVEGEEKKEVKECQGNPKNGSNKRNWSV